MLGPDYGDTLLAAARALAVPALLAVVVALTPTPVRASACCMSATAVGTGRLLPWERFALGLRSTAAFHVGTWDDDAGFRAAGHDYTETELRNELWGLLRVVPRLSVGLSAPLVLTVRRAGDLHDAGGGLGDLRGAVRWDAIPVGEAAGIPGVALVASLVAPTGRSMSETNTVLGTDVTGRGAWVLGAGASVEHVVMPYFVRADLGATVPLPMARPDLGVEQRFGPGLEAALSAGRDLGSGVVASLWARAAWEGDLTLDGRTVRDTSHLGIALGLALSFRIQRWTVQGSADTGLFASGLGHNQSGRVVTALMGRYGN